MIDTINDLSRDKEFILHSDHGSQYSSHFVKEETNVTYKISMGRVGNSLDNREVEYFFGCLKGEYLNHVKTWIMSPPEIEKHITWYVNWYNTKRIQKRLQWKAPADASAYAI